MVTILKTNSDNAVICNAAEGIVMEEVTDKNGNKKAHSTILRLHFIITEEDNFMTGYTDRLSDRFRLPLLKAGTGRPIAYGKVHQAAFSELVGDSNSGSSVKDTLIVSPIPSSRSVPIPIADLILPSSPSPASVTPK